MKYRKFAEHLRVLARRCREIAAKSRDEEAEIALRQLAEEMEIAIGGRENLDPANGAESAPA